MTLTRAAPRRPVDAGLAAALDQAGSASALARLLHITPAAVLQWQTVPHARIVAVEQATGIGRHILRPELYPHPERPAGSLGDA